MTTVDPENPTNPWDDEPTERLVDELDRLASEGDRLNLQQAGLVWAAADRLRASTEAYTRGHVAGFAAGCANIPDELARLRKERAEWLDAEMGADVETEPALHIIRRADGAEVNDEYGFVTCDGPNDWQTADDNEHELYDEEVVYEILACHVVATRTFGAPEDDEDVEVPA